MPQMATKGEVLKNEVETEITANISANTWIPIHYDAEMPIKPDFVSLLIDQPGLTVTAIDISKKKIKVKFDGQVNAGTKIKVKVKPKRV